MKLEEINMELEEEIEEKDRRAASREPLLNRRSGSEVHERQRSLG